MIGIIFQYMGEHVEVRVHQSNVLFRTKQIQQFIPIEGLKLDKKGVIREFPDLKDDGEWKKKAIKRFKEKVKSMDTENEQIQYIMEDLKKYGYKPMFLQKQGRRPIKLS